MSGDKTADEVLKQQNEITAETLKQQNKSVKQLREDLENMKGIPASKESIAFSVLCLIPGFKKAAENIKGSKNIVAGMFGIVPVANQFVGAVSGAGKAITQAVQIGGTINSATKAASNAFSYLKLASAAVDFIRIPAIYIGAAITGQKVPFTWKKNASFVYSAALLGLAITAIVFPPAAPVIGLVVALGALGQSVLTLANLYDKRNQLEDKRKRLEGNDSEISNKESKVKALNEELKKLERELTEAAEKGNQKLVVAKTLELENKKKILKVQEQELQVLRNSPHQGEISKKKSEIDTLITHLETLESELNKAVENNDEETIEKKKRDIKSQREVIELKFDALQSLENDLVRCKQKLEKVNPTAAMDKTVGLAFATLGVIGAVVSLLVPPVGIGILAATASLAVTYTVARIAFPLMKALVGKIVDAVTKKSNVEPEHKEDNELDIGVKATNSDGLDVDPEQSKSDELTAPYAQSIKTIFDNPKIKKEADRLEQEVDLPPIHETPVGLSETLIKTTEQKPTITPVTEEPSLNVLEKESPHI